MDPSRARRSKVLFVRFAEEKSGSVAIIFGLMALVVFMTIGVAFDFARWNNARNQTQAAADAAVLAGARALQTNGGDQAAAITVARTYYAQAVKNRITVKIDTVNFAVADNGTSVTTTGNATVATPFMALGGVRSLQLYRASGADYSTAKLSVGNNAQISLETSLILDISASMAGQKIADLKSAASDLINIVVWDDQSKYTSRVALVPYAVAVNAGTYATLARGIYLPGASTLPGSQNYKFKNTANQNTTFGISTCVSERTGLNAYTDVGPLLFPVGRNYAAPSNPCLTNTVFPLSDDKDALVSQIGALQASGSTGGQVGVAWGWYTLSPNWGGVWPAASKPAPYLDLVTRNAQGQPKLKKIAVLMTDGEYNSPYCNGVIAQDATVGSGSTLDHINCNASNGSAYAQALQTCAAMKLAGIEIYTVGFLLIDSQNARDLMAQCASDTQHTYVSSDGEELKQAFRDIALKISRLYLTN